jgi:hypothetical protein
VDCALSLLIAGRKSAWSGRIDKPDSGEGGFLATLIGSDKFEAGVPRSGPFQIQYKTKHIYSRLIIFHAAVMIVLQSQSLNFS